MIFAIAKHEVGSLFKARLGWFVLGGMQIIMGFSLFFLMRTYKTKLHFDASNVKGPTYEIIVLFFALTTYFILFLIPAITTRSITLERRNSSLLFLLTKPVSVRQIIIGKFIGLVGFLLIVLLLMLTTVAFAIPGGAIDFGVVVSAWTGVLLAVIAYTAIAIFISSLTTQPIIALLGSTFTLLFFIFIEIFANLKVQWIDSLIQSISLMGHLNSPTLGILSSVDIFYFIIVTIFFLYLTELRFSRFYHTGIAD